MPVQFEEEHIVAKANRLAREAVKAAAALHDPKPFQHHGGVSINCCTCMESWPCKTITVLGEAEEAVAEAEDEEARIAGGPYVCGALVRPARMYGDPEPAEYCDNETPYDDQPCPEHDPENAGDGPDADDLAYDAWKERDL